MTKALITRDRSTAFTPEELDIARRVLTTALRGIDDQNHKRWVRFLQLTLNLESGEIVEIGTKIPRSGPYHRFHMLVEQTVFNAQDKFKHFEQFRNWLKVGAGFCDWVAGPKGGVIPMPRSISYADLDESSMRQFHEDMLKFLRDEHAPLYLWKHLGEAGAAEMMETILTEFDRDSDADFRKQTGKS